MFSNQLGSLQHEDQFSDPLSLWLSRSNNVGILCQEQVALRKISASSPFLYLTSIFNLSIANLRPSFCLYLQNFFFLPSLARRPARFLSLVSLLYSSFPVSAKTKRNRLQSVPSLKLLGILNHELMPVSVQVGMSQNYNQP